MSRRLVALLFSVTLLLVCAQVVSASDENRKDRIITVMTRNLDAGSDFGLVLQAASDPDATQQQLLMAITQTYRQMHGSRIARRADGIAAEIQLKMPDLIGLQEVTTLLTGPYGGLATQVVDDGLQSLLSALEKRGLHYVPLAVQTNAQVQLPAFDESFNLIMVGLIDFDAVLVRSDIPELKIQRVWAGHFGAYLSFPVAGQSIPFVRGWIALNAKLRGQRFRFVTTHLETLSPDYQAAQTTELLNGPLHTELPLILAGDLNSDASLPMWESGPAYGILTSAGFDDIWRDLYHNERGLTWPLFAEDPVRPARLLQRIDLILNRGQGIQGLNISRTGMNKVRGLWSSDHAGVVASFKLAR